MSEFVNTVDLIGDEELTKQIVERTITELKDNMILKLRDSALSYCQKLETVDLPMCEEVGDSSLARCIFLKNVNLPRVKKIMYGSFDNCIVLETLKLPSVTAVPSASISNVHNLKTLDFSSQVRIDGISGSTLTALILRSETICSITKDALKHCYHISGTVNATYNPDGLKDGYIYVPRALIESYKITQYSSTYADQYRVLEDFTVDGTVMGELDPSKI